MTSLWTLLYIDIIYKQFDIKHEDILSWQMWIPAGTPHTVQNLFKLFLVAKRFSCVKINDDLFLYICHVRWELVDTCCYTSLLYIMDPCLPVLVITHLAKLVDHFPFDVNVAEASCYISCFYWLKIMLRCISNCLHAASTNTNTKP